jgi:hypothetical protein
VPWSSRIRDGRGTCRNGRSFSSKEPWRSNLTSFAATHSRAARGHEATSTDEGPMMLYGSFGVLGSSCRPGGTLSGVGTSRGGVPAPRRLRRISRGNFGLHLR